MFHSMHVRVRSHFCSIVAQPPECSVGRPHATATQAQRLPLTCTRTPLPLRPRRFDLAYDATARLYYVSELYSSQRAGYVLLRHA